MGADGNTNPLQATQAPDAGTTSPDLVSATFDAADDASDRVMYTFDEPIRVFDDTDADGPADPRDTDTDGDNGQGDFRLCPVTGGEGTRATGFITSENDRQIVAVFPNSATGNAVGANVEEEAVVGATVVERRGSSGATRRRGRRPERLSAADLHRRRHRRAGPGRRLPDVERNGRSHLRRGPDAGRRQAALPRPR